MHDMWKTFPTAQEEAAKALNIQGDTILRPMPTYALCQDIKCEFERPHTEILAWYESVCVTEMSN